MTTVLLGSGPDQISLNGMLGKAAFMDADIPHTGPFTNTQSAPTIVSATTIAPTATVTFVSGTTTLSTITVPQQMLTTGGKLILIATGLWTTNTSGNIATVISPTLNQMVIFTYDSITGKWYTDNTDTVSVLINKGLYATGAAAPTIASANTIAPTTPVVFISGTTAIATITPPTPISLGGGSIILIPTGIFTTTTAGNIALASTAVVNKTLIMTYDSTTNKWYPSY